MDANRTTHAHSEQDAHIYGDCHATRAHRHGDLYPKFYPVAHGATLADRFAKQRLVSITDSNGSTTDSDTDDAAIATSGAERAGNSGNDSDNHAASIADPDSNGDTAA